MNNCIKVKIAGKNVNNYIKWLINKKISINNLKVIKHDELHIIIDYKDYDLLSKYSKTYKITIIEKYGKLRLLDVIKKNIIILSCLVFSIVFLNLLSNIIFKVEVVYNDKEIVTMIEKELKKYGIEKFKPKKSYEYLEKVKEEILNNHKDNLEWLEIEESGTKYTVKLVERKKEEHKDEYLYQSIVASKDAVITSIKAYSGEKTKQVNEYVKKDDVIINGIIEKPDTTKIYTQAKGIILGEVWYKIDVEYPLFYQEEKVTGKSKNIVSIYFLNKKFPLLPYKKYKQFKTNAKILLESNLLPIKIVKENQYEVIIKEEIYTNEEAVEKAKELAQEKILNHNEKIKSIKTIEILNKQNTGNVVKVSLFVSVIEDITKIIEIKEPITTETPLQE